MARTEVMLSVRGATLTNDSAGSAIAQVVREVTTDTTDPQLAQFVAKFDDSTDEHLFWQFRLPGNYRSPQDGGYPKAHVQFHMDADQADDEKAVRFQVALLSVGPRGENGEPMGHSDEMTSLDISNDGEGWVTGTALLDHADPATKGRLYQISMSLAGDMGNTSGGDYVVIGVRRDADHASDTATGDACVVAVSFEYTVG